MPPGLVKELFLIWTIFYRKKNFSKASKAGNSGFHTSLLGGSVAPRMNGRNRELIKLLKGKRINKVSKKGRKDRKKKESKK